MERETEESKDGLFELGPQRIKLRIGDTVIVADKQKLINNAAFFKKLFRRKPSGSTEICLDVPKDVDEECFITMLNMLSYPGLKLEITAGNLWDCILFSEYFDAERIDKVCSEAFEKILPTLEADEMIRLWRNGNAASIEKAVAKTLVGISLKMESARESAEFLNVSMEELIELISHKSFLLISERTVCEAIRAWCDHDPDNRRTNDIMERLFENVVWDDTTTVLIRSICPDCKEPAKMPKRSENGSICNMPDDGVLDALDASCGIMIENYLYFLQNWTTSRNIKTFCRMDLIVQEHVEKLRPVDVQELKLHSEGGDDPEAKYAEFSGYTLCRAKLADGDQVICFASNLQSLLHMGENVYNICNMIALYDISTNVWQTLPRLPLRRADCAVVQDGSYLYVIGGNEYQALEDEGGNAHYCLRLDLIKFTVMGNRDVQWERIADLNAARIEHKARIQHGRIIVYDGRTLTKEVNGKNVYEKAPWLEVYHPILNMWIVINSAA